MPGNLAPHLARAFAELLPDGWTAEPEAPLLPSAYARRIGYTPKADLLLHAKDGRRIAVELEVSRADPVANQAKALLAYDSGALHPDRDVFVSCLSPHIQRGRRNLAALFARHMRGKGLPAFGVSLLPGCAPLEIARLNQLAADELEKAILPLRGEVDRVLDVVQPIADRTHRIHFAGDAADVIANLWAWNDAMERDPALSWATRRTQFWVMDPASRSFAPSKFCAYVPVRGAAGVSPPPTMTPEVYATLGEQDPAFDGCRARMRLVEKLCFRLAPMEEHEAAWRAWSARFGDRIALRGDVALLLPPAWW